MAGLGVNFNISGIVLLLAILFVVIGLVLAVMVLFKRAEHLTEEDHLHYKRALLLWTGSAAIALVSIYAAKKEKYYMGKGMGLHLGVSAGSTGSARSASLL